MTGRAAGRPPALDFSMPARASPPSTLASALKGRKDEQLW